MVVHSLIEMEVLLPQLICPYCYHSELEAVLRCDINWHETCLATIRCTRCGHMFNPDTDRLTLKTIQRRVLEEPLRLPCPTCDSHFADTVFRCTLADRRCAYAIECHACGAVHLLPL